MHRSDELASHLRELICSRRTVHRFEPGALSDTVPSEDVVSQALEVACSAPNHRMTEPWRFIRVGPKTRQRLYESALQLKQAQAELSSQAASSLKDKFLSPAELVVVCQVRHQRPEVAREDYAAVACAIHNLSLSLWSRGIGSKWSTGSVMTEASTYELFGVDIQEQEIVAFVWVGLPLSSVQKPIRRRSLAEVVRRLP